MGLLDFELYILLNRLVLLFVVVFSLLLGWIVFSTNRKVVPNRLFLVMSILFSAWPTFGYFTYFAGSESEARIWASFAYATVSIFVFIFYYFFVFFFHESRRSKGFGVLIGLAGMLFVVISFTTNWIVADIVKQDVGVLPIFGGGAYAFYTYVLIVFLMVFSIFYRNYRKSSSLEKKRIQFFFIGITIFLLLNVAFNIVVPIVRESYELHQFGNYATIFLLGFTAYAIAKNKLFGAKVIITTMFVLLIGIFLFVDLIIFTDTFSLRVVKSAMLIGYLVFGRALIRSVKKEIKQREEIQKLAKDLEKANKRLKALDKTKSEFLSIASHQLRTPISGIKGYLSMLIDGDFGKVNDDQKKIVEQVYDNTERLNGLVNDFLDVSRIERGKMQIERQETDIVEMVDSIFQNFVPVAKDKGLEFVQIKPTKEIPKLNVDPIKLRQVFLNLVDNAIKYTPEGKIEVKLEGGENELDFKVIDTGVGLAPGEGEHLFRPFSRAKDASKSNTSGTGLGLYVARKIVQYHGGKIEATSEGKGKGSVFHVTVPYDQDSVPEPEPEPYLE